MIVATSSGLAPSSRAASPDASPFGGERVEVERVVAVQGHARIEHDHPLERPLLTSHRRQLRVVLGGPGKRNPRPGVADDVRGLVGGTGGVDGNRDPAGGEDRQVEAIVHMGVFGAKMTARSPAWRPARTSQEASASMRAPSSP